MIGLVIVSHSVKAAEGIRDIAQQMAPEITMIAAGGTADDEIGTDTAKIQAAILAAHSGDGVVILADLGSAVLSAETAMEFLDETLQPYVRIADAPLLEGAVSAAVQASIGSSLEEVISAAAEAYSLRKL